MKSANQGRHDRRPARRPLKPEERAGLHRVALEYRAALRANPGERGQGPVPAPVGRLAPAANGEAQRRARFAAGVARAEFGRFYWKEGDVPRRKPARPQR